MDAATIVALTIGILASIASLLNTVVVFILALWQMRQADNLRRQQLAFDRWRAYSDGGEFSPIKAMNWLRTQYFAKLGSKWLSAYLVRDNDPESTELHEKADIYRKVLRIFWELTVEAYETG